LPAFPCQWLPGYARNRAQRRLTDLPNFSCLQLVCKQTKSRGMRAAAERVHHSARLRFCLARGFRAELSEKPSSTFREQRDALRVHPFAPCVFDQQIVHALETDRAVRHHFWDEVSALEDVTAAHRQQYTLRRALDQAASCF